MTNDKLDELIAGLNEDVRYFMASDGNLVPSSILMELWDFDLAEDGPNGKPVFSPLGQQLAQRIKETT